MAQHNQIQFIYLLNNNSQAPKPFPKDLYQQTYSESKAKQMLHSKTIFDETTAKEFDFIYNKKLMNQGGKLA